MKLELELKLKLGWFGSPGHQYCEKRFVVKNDLTRHILIHTGVKDFKCDNCGRQFNKKSHMDGHIKNKVCSKK